MSDNNKITLAFIVAVLVFALAVVAGVTAVKLNRGWTDPGYVTVNGKHMRCVVLQITQTETAASCDWDALREDD